MTKIPFVLLLSFIILCMSSEVSAQSDVALAARKAQLKALTEKLKKRDENDRRQVQDFVRRTGISRRRELPNGKVLELQRIAPGIGPVFYITNNLDAADTVSTDEVWPGGSAGLDLDGSGMTLGEWDGGAVYAHPDFLDKTEPVPQMRVTQADNATIVSGHATHVAGTLIGNGESGLDEFLSPQARGMAYAAHLDAYDWNEDTTEMSSAAATGISPLNGLLVSNHSYGIAAGWIDQGAPTPEYPTRWLWIGGADPSIMEDSNFGYYDTEAANWDDIAYLAPYYLIVKAVGNDRTDIGPVPAEPYIIINQNGVPQGEPSTDPRRPDCWPETEPAGYDCLPTTSVAKNILTVGAVYGLTGGYSPFAGPSSVQMAEMSSWGPTDDGRIKPDLVAKGMFLVSTWPDDTYYLAGGTSMSAPNVAGSLLLLQEHFQETYGAGNFMRAATLKALAIHTADEAGAAAGPDYSFGWGLLNTKAAAEVIGDTGEVNHRIIEGVILEGETNIVVIPVAGTDALVTATLVWTDPPGTPVDPPTLDAEDPMLVNDLDLLISKDGTDYEPWVLDPTAPAQAATRGKNHLDNVEQVVVDGGTNGNYSVQVSHTGTLQGGEQHYSLIFSAVPRLTTDSVFLIDEEFSAGLPAGWSVVTDSGVDWTINTPVDCGPYCRLDNLTGGTGKFAMVDNGSSYDTDTSLLSPVFDLSSAAAVVVRFRSYFVPDESESITVGISTDGGSNWADVLTTYDFNLGANFRVLDLTGLAAGQANFMLRFRFDSGGGPAGDLWQVDDVQLEVFGSALDGSAPTFTPAAAVGRQQGSPAGAAVTIGTVNDLETAAGDLSVMRIAGGTASGIMVGDIVNTDGTVTATLAAACSATSGTVRFAVSDGGLLVGSGDLQLNITANSAPDLSYVSKSLGFGGSSTHPAQNGPTDNGSVISVSVQNKGTYTGAISVDSVGLVSISNAQPVGAHTITIRATDDCGGVTDATFQLQVDAVVPGAPTMGAATAWDAKATVSFTPPDFDGGSTITTYTATSSPGGLTGVRAGSPITVQGLTNGQPYTFTVTATNGIGTGPASEASNEVTPVAAPSAAYVPVAGCRVMDTRHWDREGVDAEFPLPAQTAVTIHFSNENGDIPLQGGALGGCPDIPDDASAYVVTLSAFLPGYWEFDNVGYATLVPYDPTGWTEYTEHSTPGASENILYTFDSPPFATAASLTFDEATTLISNTTTVQACQGCFWHGMLFASSEANFTVDVVGYYTK